MGQKCEKVFGSSVCHFNTSRIRAFIGLPRSAIDKHELKEMRS